MLIKGVVSVIEVMLLADFEFRNLNAQKELFEILMVSKKLDSKSEVLECEEFVEFVPPKRSSILTNSLTSELDLSVFDK